VQYTLVTKGRKGMELYDNGNPDPFVIPTEPIPIYNVSGCGDVVVAVMSVCLSTGLSPLESAKIANRCAGYTATLPGTSVISEEKFKRYMEIILNEQK
jgi:bifunctional ADP-heptose synthase (sugar kinase/adenylyltransferase)